MRTGGEGWNLSNGIIGYPLLYACAEFQNKCIFPVPGEGGDF